MSPPIFSEPLRRLLLGKDKPDNYWLWRGEKRALRLFYAMAERVPAYKDVLKKHGVTPSLVASIADFRHLPILDKDNYLRRYPLWALCWDGCFAKGRYTISSTSGSTGEPFYFPRTEKQVDQYALLAELYLRENFFIHTKSTLYIDAFPMGPWIGGVFTYETIKLVANRSRYNLSIITTGINKLDIIQAVKKFGRDFDQIIIGSYAPFLKDALDAGEALGIRWADYSLRFIFSAEGFSEQFRDYIIRKAGLANEYITTLNHYGTVDLGTMAYETPISIWLRRFVLSHPHLYQWLFGQSAKLPTLCQYFPELFYFEEVQGNLICSAASGLPLIRYDLKDHGGVRTWREVYNNFRENNADIDEYARKACINSTIWHLPFVFVYERSDFSVSLYAFQIYPETIRRSLEDRRLEPYISGKFTMMVKYTEKHNQYLEINIELKQYQKGGVELEKRVQEIIIARLLKENSEYAKTYGEMPDRLLPRIIFWPHEHPTHFQSDIKQKWVKK